MAKSKGYPAFCSRCHEAIDLGIVSGKARVGKRYVHPCGRVLLKGTQIAGGERNTAGSLATGPQSPPASSSEEM